MADMKQVFQAFENIGRQAGYVNEAQKNAALGFLSGFGGAKLGIGSGVLRPGVGPALTDNKAAAAYHPLDPRVFNPAATFTTGAPPQSAKERRKLLQITKAPEAFLLRLPASAPENLLGRQGHRHFGDWRVEVIEDDRPFLLESFDEYDEAVAYVAHVLRTIGDEGADIEDEYASVGEVPC